MPRIVTLLRKKQQRVLRKLTSVAKEFVRTREPETLSNRALIMVWMSYTMPHISMRRVSLTLRMLAIFGLIFCEGMDALERNKSKHVVAPGINWLIATLHDAGMFGYSTEKAEQVGYQKELDTAIRALREMHRRGIVVLPGG
jgi:hypothetical protein